MRDYDAIVVGAGPAGCAAAYDLARAGRSVLLLDRRSFPRLKPCAGALTMKTLRALRYSVAPVIQQVCRESRMSRESRESRIFSGPYPFCAMTVRSELDEFCLRQTIAAGAEFRRIDSWSRLEETDGFVRLDTCDGPLRAKFLVGADGANSQVRRCLGGSPWFFAGLALETNLPRDGQEFPMEFDFGVLRGGYGWIFPKRDHYSLGLFTCLPESRIDREMVDSYARQRLGRSHGQVVGHKIGFGGWDYVPSSRRVFLVGDAAGLVDALLGEGIYNAVKSGQEAAAAIESELRGGTPARAVFAHQLRPIQRDAELCFHAARRFYADMDRGYAALVSPLIRYSLVKGYSLGWTFSQIKSWFFTLPLVTWRTPVRLLEP